ncbi:patatin-like phospholipase family protein [Stenotrophomonas sp. NLF4-10]|uniref:patatin-like phospholipase family protein n=1 Tax=Stenotrophomonas sp. NLF4-10 TaxID=2918754 RepID=UPI001EFBB0E6|nr:patatin-like phospholipase family protein [Stenotrophomonas sp. NLF4-10]MCG8274965.1 patatin-like phospholipase family protein [Stenotrophomonas sp. NLF4-10]
MKPLRPRLLLPLALLGLLAACGGGNVKPAAPVATPVVPATPVAPVKIGVALGGGAAKGFAHIGVIKMLEANGFEPVVVSGTSAGSVVGALYASGMDAFEMQQKAVALDQASIRDVRLFSGGLIEGRKLQDYVNAQVDNKPAERLSKPFAAVATQLETGERAVFVRGNVGQAVRASSSVPGVFEPVSIGGKTYVDGGVVSPVPVDAARQLGAEFVIAVDISSKASGQRPDSLLGTVNQSIAIMGQRLGEQELARADVVIRPQVLDIGAADFEQRGRAILEGEKAAMAAMPQIRAGVQRLQQARLQQLRDAQARASAAAAEAYQRCQDSRSRLEKLRGKEKDCAAPVR